MLWKVGLALSVLLMAASARQWFVAANGQAFEGRRLKPTAGAMRMAAEITALTFGLLALTGAAYLFGL